MGNNMREVPGVNREVFDFRGYPEVTREVKIYLPRNHPQDLPLSSYESRQLKILVGRDSGMRNNTTGAKKSSIVDYRHF